MSSTGARLKALTAIVNAEENKPPNVRDEEFTRMAMDVIREFASMPKFGPSFTSYTSSANG